MSPETPSSSEFNPLAAIEHIPVEERQPVYILATEGSPEIIASGNSISDIPFEIREKAGVCIHYASHSVGAA